MMRYGYLRIMMHICHVLMSYIGAYDLLFYYIENEYNEIVCNENINLDNITIDELFNIIIDSFSSKFTKLNMKN
jgi:hypothetical protein